MIRIALLAALGLAPLLSARDARAGQATIIDEVVAMVGNEAILRSEVIAKARMSEAMAKADTPAAIDRVRREVLDNIIETALIVTDALHRGLRVSPLEVAQAKERVLRQMGGTHEALRAELARRNVTVREYDATIAAELLEQKWLALVVKTHLKTPVPLASTPEAEALFLRDLAAERKRALAELRKTIFVEVRW